MKNYISNIGVPGGYPLAIDRPTIGIPLPGVNMSSINLRSYGRTPELQKAEQSALKKVNFVKGVKDLITPLLPGAVSSLFDFGLSALGSSIQNRYQKKAEQRSNEEWQRRFDEENAYNHPLAQSGRFEKAGINPLSGLGSATPAASPSVAVSSGATAPVSSPIATNAATSTGIELTEEQIVSESFKQQLLQAQKENEISRREGQQLENAFNAIVFEDNVVKFKSEVKQVLYGLTKQEIELPYYQYMCVLDILTKEQGLQIGQAQAAQLWASVNQLNASAELQREQKRLVQLEFDKLDWQKQAKVLDYFFDYIKQNRMFAHDKEMLEMSQNWNEEQNKKDRVANYTGYVVDIIKTLGYGACTVLGAAITVGSGGAAAVPGAGLAAIGLTGMANTMNSFGQKPHRRIGF